MKKFANYLNSNDNDSSIPIDCQRGIEDWRRFRIGKYIKALEQYEYTVFKRILNINLAKRLNSVHPEIIRMRMIIPRNKW